MFLNIRYHIFTITAIFAALGIGILIGFSIIGNEGIVEEQRKLINDIGLNIEKLKEENQNLKTDLNQFKAQLAKRQELERKILPLVLENRFPDKSFLLIGDQEKDLIQDLKLSLETAGAVVYLADSFTEDMLSPEVDKVIISEGQFIKIQKQELLEKIMFLKEDQIYDFILELLRDEGNEEKQENFGNYSSLQ